MERKKLNINEIEEGMLSAKNVFHDESFLLVRENMELEWKHINLFKAAGIEEIEVLIPEKPGDEEKELTVDDFPEHAETLMSTKVLIVDDSKLMRFKLKKIVEGAGLAIAGEAENGKEAVAKAKELEPTFITMDIEMPEMDGISALEPIAAQLPDAKIIMISSVGDEERIIESITRGALDFINKPFDPLKVRKVILNTIISDFPHL